MSSLRKKLEGLSIDQVESLFNKLGLNEQIGTRKLLRAFIQLEDDKDINSIRVKIKEQLPTYMQPSEVIGVERLPLLPNGKVDVKALLSIKDAPKEREPIEIKELSELEESLLDIWIDVLGTDYLNIHDNFFEVGGDSILSIQIVAKARNKGIKIPPNSIFEFQSVCELAAHIESQTPKEITYDPIVGSVPLSPIQHWFFNEFKSRPYHWNQSIMVEDEVIDSLNWRESVKDVIKNNDALRLNFRNPNGQWEATIRNDVRNVYQPLDLSSSNFDLKILEESLIPYQDCESLENGNLFRVYECRFKDKVVLVFIAHHLVIDNLSWGLFIDQLKKTKDHLVSELLNEPDYGHWAQKISEKSFTDELEFWTNQISEFALNNQFDNLQLTENQCLRKQIALSREDSRIINDATKQSNINAVDFICASLLSTLEQKFNHRCFTIGFEHNGRLAQEDIDPSSLLGWFTSFYPLKFELGNNDSNIDQLFAVKEIIRSVPNNGVGYGFLKYRDQLIRPSNIEILINYLGNSSEGSYRFLHTGTRYKESERSVIIELNAYLRNDLLNIDWVLPDSEFFLALPKEFNDQLNKLISDYSESDIKRHTISDFKESGLSQEDLNSLFN